MIFNEYRNGVSVPTTTDSSTRTRARQAPAIALARMLLGGDKQAALEAVEQGGPVIEALANPYSPCVTNALASHLQVLEATFLKCQRDALGATTPRDKSRLLKAGLQAQTNYVRTVALMAKLKASAYNWSVVDV